MLQIPPVTETETQHWQQTVMTGAKIKSSWLALFGARLQACHPAYNIRRITPDLQPITAASGADHLYSRRHFSCVLLSVETLTVNDIDKMIWRFNQAPQRHYLPKVHLSEFLPLTRSDFTIKQDAASIHEMLFLSIYNLEEKSQIVSLVFLVLLLSGVYGFSVKQHTSITWVSITSRNLGRLQSISCSCHLNLATLRIAKQLAVISGFETNFFDLKVDIFMFVFTQMYAAMLTFHKCLEIWYDTSKLQPHCYNREENGAPEHHPKPCSHTDLVRQDYSRSSTDAHDGHSCLSGNEVQDLCHGLRANIVLEHHAMDAVGGECVADPGEQCARVGVVDQHCDGVHLQRKVHEVLPTQPSFNLRLVGWAAEHHCYVHGGHRVPKRPSWAAWEGAEQQQQ